MCRRHPGALGFDLPKNVKAFPVHCTSRIDTLDLLKAFEAGAEGVAIVRCSSGTCKYRDIEPRVKARVKRAQDLIKALGIDPARIEILSLPSSGNENPFGAVTAEFFRSR
jgi:coenzyme F420-reducing hydrogenase delta subunit